MRRPRILTAYLRTHYVHGTGDSNEWGLFGNGLWSSMGWDEVYQPFEIAPDIAALREQGPYDAAFYMPYLEAPLWIRDVVGSGAPIIAWIPDDAWRFESFTRTLIEKGAADHYITTAEEALSRYVALGMEDHVTVSGYGTRPDWWPTLVQRRETAEAKASFVGLCYGDRMRRLQDIANAAEPETMLMPLDVHDTHASVLPLAAYHQHMADSAFTLALTSSSHGQPQAKARLWEPQLHGSILVTEPAPLLADYWTPDVDCLVFTTPAEAQAKMFSLMADPEAYQAMAQRAYVRACLSNSFQARFVTVFDRLGLWSVLPDFSALLPEGVQSAP